MKSAAWVALLVLGAAGVCSAGPGAALRGMLEGERDAGSIWALLVAGSSTWMNYRHQVGSVYHHFWRPLSDMCY